LDTAIIVGVMIGSVVAIALVFGKTVLSVAWTGNDTKRLTSAQNRNKNKIVQEHLQEENDTSRMKGFSKLSKDNDNWITSYSKKSKGFDSVKQGSFQVTIDGSDLNTFAYDITNAKVQSNLFGIEVPEDNILGISAQNISGIAAGDWVFLKPSVFVPGIHKISFTGKLNGTLSDVSYSLNITGSGK
jgi:hypothetical protein